MIFFLLSMFFPVEVTKVCDRLGDDRWLVREGASRSLERIGQRARPALLLYSRNSDPEVAARAREILAQDDAKFLASLTHPLPCIDCLCWNVEKKSYNPGSEWAPVVQAYLEICQTDTGVASFSRYRNATGFMLLDMRNGGMPDWAVRAVLRHMEKIEEDIPVTCGGRREFIPAPDGSE